MKKIILLLCIVAPSFVYAEDDNEVLMKAFETTKQVESCQNLQSEKNVIRQPKKGSTTGYVFTHWVIVDGYNLTIHIEENDGLATDYSFHFNMGEISLNGTKGLKCFENRTDYIKCKNHLKTTKDLTGDFYSQTSVVTNKYNQDIQINALACAGQLLNAFKNIMTANSPKK